MIDLDSELADDYLAESLDHLATMETELLALEGAGAEPEARPEGGGAGLEGSTAGREGSAAGLEGGAAGRQGSAPPESNSRRPSAG